MSRQITQIEWNNSGATPLSFPIGANFENVFLEEDGKQLTLKRLYDHLMDFFNNGTFEMYSTQEPLNDNIKVWYHIQNI